MLKELFFLIKKYSKDNFIKSQAEFMDWFLGNQTSYGNTMLKYLYKEERRLELKNRIKISKNAEWELSKFDDVKNLKNEMKGLFENVFKMSSDELGLNQMLRAFLNQYLFEAIYPEKIFEEYTGQVCHNHIYEKKYTSFFGEAWETSNIVVIYGKGGIGKTQLVKSYLQENKGYYKEICVVDDFMSVKEALLGIPFLINDKKNIEETIHILKEKSNDSVIAIDIPDLKKEDIELIGKLIGLELRVIIITHQKLPIENIYQKQLNSLEDETLRKIFDVNVDKKDFIMSEEQFEKLLDIVERNTLVIALLGKCLGKKDGHIPMDELLNEDEWIWNKTKLKTVHASEYGQKEGKTPIRHIIAILDKYCVMQEEYSELAIWCKSAMSVDGLRQWCRFSENIIPEAYRKGIVEYEDSDKKIIRIHSLIADAIWKFYPIEYQEYQNNINNFLNNIKWGNERFLNYNMLYNGMYNCVQRFGFEISKKINKKRKTDKNVVFEYHENLYSMIDFSIQSGNYYGAERLLYFWDELFDDERFKRDLWEFELSWINDNKENLLILKNKYKIFPAEQMNKINMYDFLNVYCEFLEMTLDILVRTIRVLKCQREISILSQDDSLQNASDKSGEIDVNIFLGIRKNFIQLLNWYIEVIGIFEKSAYVSYQNYYIFVKNYYSIVLKSIIGELQSEADKIVEYIRFLDMVEFPELKMKTQLEITYWRMLYLINNATSKEEVRKVIDEFEILKKEYQNKIFPIDVELLFGEVEVLKSALEQDRDTLCESVKNLSSVFEKRVEMKVTSHEIKRIQEVVPEIIERIQNFPL